MFVCIGQYLYVVLPLMNMQRFRARCGPAELLLYWTVAHPFLVVSTVRPVIAYSTNTVMRLEGLR